MKIMLIFPNLSEATVARNYVDQLKFQIRGIYPTLGLAYIAGALENADHEVVFVDANAECLAEEKVEERIKSFSPRVVGFYCGTLMIDEVRKFARVAKKVDEKIVTVVGGPHLSVFPEVTLEAREFDIGVIGEGEKTICELVDTIDREGDVRNVAGIVFRNGSETVKTDSREYSTDLDSIPFPAWHLMPIEKYHDILSCMRGFVPTMITSRGCPFKCIFCSPECRLGRKFRYRSPQNVLEEILYLKRYYEIKEVCFYDDSFTVNKKRVHSLCDKMIESNINIKWECRTRVDLVDDAILEKMAAAGCFRIRYGIESGDNDILKRLRKDITVEQSRKAVELTKRYGIEVFGYFMVGNPGENRRTVEKTIALSRELDFDYINVNVLSLRPPGSELFDWAAESGFIDKDYWERFSRGEDLNPAPVLEKGELHTKELERYMRKAYACFYLRPSYLLKSVVNRQRLVVILRIISSYLSLLKKSILGETRN